MDRRIGTMMRANTRPDTPADIEWRTKSREAAQAAISDREAKYPTLTADNAAEAIRYQEQRVDFHARRLGVR